jgi:hypothetical protein
VQWIINSAFAHAWYSTLKHRNFYLWWTHPDSLLLDNIEDNNTDLDDDDLVFQENLTSPRTKTQSDSELDSPPLKRNNMPEMKIYPSLARSFCPLVVDRSKKTAEGETIPDSPSESENLSDCFRSVKRKRSARSRWQFLHAAVLPTCFAAHVSRLMNTLSVLLSNICSVARISASKDSTDQERGLKYFYHVCFIIKTDLQERLSSGLLNRILVVHRPYVLLAMIC